MLATGICYLTRPVNIHLSDQFLINEGIKNSKQGIKLGSKLAMLINV